jgi:hypothetical protein
MQAVAVTAEGCVLQAAVGLDASFSPIIVLDNHLLHILSSATLHCWEVPGTMVGHVAKYPEFYVIFFRISI